jgi:hypothetical protein
MIMTDQAIELWLYDLIEANTNDANQRLAKAWLATRVTTYEAAVELGLMDGAALLEKDQSR